MLLMTRQKDETCDRVGKKHLGLSVQNIGIDSKLSPY